MSSRNDRNGLALVVVAVLTAITSAPAADTNYWTNSASGLFYTGANYADGTAPVNNNGDIVYFTNDASYTVTYGGFNGGALYFNAPGGVVTNNLTGVISLGYAPSYLGVGDSAGSTATVVQVGANQMSANLYFGNQGVGSYTVSGAGALLNAPSYLYVGLTNGSAGSSLLVTNGAKFTGNLIYLGTYNSGNNSITVSGASTVWSNSSATTVGYTNSAFNTMRIEDGAHMVLARALDLGFAQGSSNNTVLVTGSNSYLGVGWFTSGYLQIGAGDNNNSLIVSNGASVRVEKPLYVGGTSTAITTNNNAIVTGAGSILSNTSTLYIGFTGGGNTMRVEDGARVASSSTVIMGQNATSSNNMAVVSGSNSVWDASPANLYIGYVGARNSVLLTNGGRLITAGAYFGGNNASSAGNTATATGAGTIWTNTGSLQVGAVGAGNTLRIEDGARVISAGALDLGLGANSSNNTVTVTGTNSYLEVASNSGAYLQIGQGGNNNTLLITNGGSLRVSKQLYVGGTGGTSTTNNSLIITGAGSIVSNTSSPMVIGWTGGGNTLRIENGAQMASVATGANSGGLGVTVSRNATSSNNTIIVTGSNTVWGISASGVNPEFTLGYAAGGNTMIISNGGKVRFDGTFFEIGNVNANNALTITGAGSTFSNPAANFYVGANAGVNNRLLINDGGQLYTSNLIVNTGTGNRIQVLSGGMLDANILNLGIAANNMTNFGGIYQFTTATPTVTKSGSNIILTNGTVSFRNVAAADVKGNWTGSQLTNILFQGDNTFRLNNSSNSTSGQDYTFNTGLGATNYVGLEMVGGNTAWQSSRLTISANGTFLASNTVGTVAAVVTNLGNIEVKNSMMEWSSNVVINGRYFSDPSTNTYFGDVTVGQSGTLAGGTGDLFDFKKSLFINATNNIGFQLANSAVKFSGGGMHTNSLTGADLGSNITAYSSAFELENNFAYGELHLGSVTDQVCFTCGNIPTIASNGLYIGWLDLLGSSALVTNLHVSAGITLYYDATDSRNAYLNNLSYSLTDCNFVEGGGFLMPVIPEPSALLLISMGAVLLIRRKTTNA